jgi:hypothetical protein
MRKRELIEQGILTHRPGAAIAKEHLMTFCTDPQSNFGSAGQWHRSGAGPLTAGVLIQVLGFQDAIWTVDNT